MMAFAERLISYKHIARGFAPRSAFPMLPSAKPMLGFTLIELVVVLMILAVISVAAIPRFLNHQSFESLGFGDHVVAALQYARQQAVAQRRQMCVNVLPGGFSITRAVTFNAGCTTPLASPADGKDYVVNVPNSSISIASVAPAMLPLTIVFDPAGGFAGPTLTLNVVGDVTRAVVVEAGTGHVHSP